MAQQDKFDSNGMSDSDQLFPNHYSGDKDALLDQIVEQLLRGELEIPGLDLPPIEPAEPAEHAPAVSDDTMVYGGLDLPETPPEPAPVQETSDVRRYEPDLVQQTPERPQVPDEAPALEDLEDLNTYQDSGAFRTYDGSREYRSFDATLADASPRDWYHFSDEDAELDDDQEPDDFDEEETPFPPRRGLKIFAHAVLVFVTALSIFYLIAIYSSVGFIADLRFTYIKTAMDTLNHKWLATAIIPGDIIADVMRQQYEAKRAQLNLDSNWGAIVVEEVPSFDTQASSAPEKDPTASASTGLVQSRPESEIVYGSAEEETFFDLFWELDYDSTQEYLKEHPEALANGWSGIDINKSHLNADGNPTGTSIKTIHGDQVLAINAKEGIILIRVYVTSSKASALSNSKGVLAICKDTSRLTLCAASTLGTIGQTAGRIADANNGILAMSGSAFWDPNGEGNGGTLDGLAVCSGTAHGERLGGSNKRIELRSDNKMYIVDSVSAVDRNTRDACEFGPAMILDGKIVVATNDWNSVQPRAALGQTNRLESMMLIMEGRIYDEGLVGCAVYDLAEILYQYNCVQAMNLDGGTSAIMYYDGKYVTRCSNQALPGGRTLPTAWVYQYAD